MFKKVLQSLTKSLQRQAPAAEAKAPPAKAPEPVKNRAEPAPPAPAPSARKDDAATLKKIAAPPAPPPAPKQSAEEMCGIDGKMGKDLIRERLKLLYRRFNRAASSLDAKTRAEAEVMLDAIVKVREKTFGEI